MPVFSSLSSILVLLFKCSVTLHPDTTFSRHVDVENRECSLLQGQTRVAALEKLTAETYCIAPDLETLECPASSKSIVSYDKHTIILLLT